jgi:ureidoglycolate hydrolase
MKVEKLRAKRISVVNFRRFGWVIEYPARSAASKTKNLFKVISRQPGTGWRIAYLVVRDRAIARLEQHPGSCESFEPVRGKGMLYVAPKNDPASITCFLLDKPVILKKGIWHGVVTLSREFDVKITENSYVKCIYRSL